MKKKILILTLILFAVFSIAGVCAGDVNDAVMANEDDSQIELTAIEDNIELNIDENQAIGENNVEDNGTFTALQQKINNAGDNSTIMLANNYTYDNGFAADGILINKSLTIDGKGYAINANHQARIFNIAAGNVTIKNITFINGNGDGGAIYWQANDGYLSNCIFMNNSATNGGAIFVDGGNNLIIDNSKFIKNTATRGGAVYWWDGYGSITGNSFDMNSAEDDGGAIYFRGNNGVIKDSYFTNNKAYYNGAVYMNSVQGSIIGCIFANNVATDSAGALGWVKKENGTIVNSQFVNNSAPRGGAIYLNNGTNFFIGASNFGDNAASEDGGAIFWDSGNEGRIVDSLFINNKADKFGGAIFWNNTYNGNITDSFFENNEAYDGGAIYFRGNNGIIRDSDFLNNKAYYNGAVYMNSVQGSVFDCIFANNVATDSAGALGWVKKENGTILDSKFINNSAPRGGAIYLNNGTNFFIGASSFEDNAASEDGGAIFWDSGNEGRIVGSSFINNKADMFGGAIFWNNADGNITDGLFENNEAYDGGAIYVEDGNMIVLNSKFITNTANITGGAINFAGDGLSISESEFTNNAAGDDCGAIYVYSDKAIISKSKFEGNNAPEVGVVCLFCDNALINESYFINNFATDFVAAILNAGNLTVDASLFIDSSAYSGCTIRNSMYATLTLSNSIFESDYLEGRTVDNNYGSLYLYNNTINDLSSEIHNYGGVISSPCTATVISRTPFVYGVETELIAVITDDKGNLIEEGYYVYFNVNGSLVEAEYNSEISGYEAEYVFNSLGLVEISTVCPSINITDNQGITTTVIKADSTISAPDIVFDYGLFGSTIVTLNGAIGFNATVVNCSEAFVAVRGNEIFVSNLELGNYSLNITTDPDSNHNSVSSFVKITVNKANATVIIPVTDFEYGENITIVPILDGISRIDLAFVPYHDEAVVNISEDNVITISGLDIGDYILVVSAIPDKNHKEMSAVVQNIRVTKLKTQLTASNLTATYNVAKKLVVRLEDSNGVLANKNVTVKVGTISKILTTNSEGQVSLDVSNLTPNDYTASINFAGDDNYSASGESVKVTVKKATPKLTAKSKTFKAKVKTKKYSITLKTNKNKVMKKVKVTLKVKGKTYTAKTNAKGKATFKITKLTKKGTFKATVKFKGDAYYKAVTKKVKIFIK